MSVAARREPSAPPNGPGVGGPPEAVSEPRVGRLRLPMLAVGAVVGVLMGSPAFGSHPLRAWSPVLVGQVDRGLHALAWWEGATAGLVGRARAGHDVAGRWLRHGALLGSGGCGGGPVVLIDARAAWGRTVSPVPGRGLRDAAQAPRWW